MSESSIKHYEWHRERALREKQKPTGYSDNRVQWNAREVEKKHGTEAVKELAKEFNQKDRKRSKVYFT